MGIVRRLYLYTVSAISLLVLSIGIDSLVAVALGEIVDTFGATVIGGDSSGREQLSLAIALVVVGAPVFALHWWLVGRGWRGTDEAAADDRHSAIRTFHFGLVATVALSVAIFAVLQLLDRGFRAILGGEDGAGRVADEVAILLVAAPVWWLHTTRRNADLRHDRLHGAATWLSRLYRYGWMFIGLMILLIGASQAIGTLSLAFVGRSDFGDGQDWWHGPLAWSLAAIVTGLGVWWLHLDDARRAIRDAAVIGEDDRSTSLRATYFGAVLLVALSSAGLTVAASLTELGRQLLGVADETGMTSFLESVVGPVLVAVPFVLAGWLHWRAMHDEAVERGGAPRAAVERLMLHLAALIGIVFLAVGIARLGGLLIEQVLGSVGVDDFFRGELVWCIAQILVGAVLWFPFWTAIVRRRTESPITERLATISRAFLLLVVGGALVAGVPSAVFVLYRLIDSILGGGGAGLGTEIAVPLAVVAVASVVAAYHGRLVVSDQRLASAARIASTGDARSAVGLATEVPTYDAPDDLLSATLVLTLRGASGSDLKSVVANLRDHLPPGVELDGG